MKINSLDHVALWVSDRDTLAEFACAHLGMHVIDRTDKFTLVGSDARKGKLTLFAADGRREPAPLDRVVLRVSDLERAVAALPDDLPTDRDGECVQFGGPEGLGLGLVEASNGTVDYDLDHVILRVPDPRRSFNELADLGFRPDGDRLDAVTAYLELRPGPAAETDRPLLNHLAMLVDSAEEHIAEARRRGIEVEVVDAANTYAAFLYGPDRVKLEYVEHKPGFSLT